MATKKTPTMSVPAAIEFVLADGKPKARKAIVQEAFPLTGVKDSHQINVVLYTHYKRADGLVVKTKPGFFKLNPKRKTVAAKAAATSPAKAPAKAGTKKASPRKGGAGPKGLARVLKVDQPVDDDSPAVTPNAVVLRKGRPGPELVISAETSALLDELHPEPTTKISGLTKLNTMALRETLAGAIEEGDLVVTETTATWTRATARQALTAIDAVMDRLPTKGHPRASLHAVRRKLAKLVKA